MIVLITGISGLLGPAIARAAARRGHRVLGVCHRSPAPDAFPGDSLRIDLTDDGLVTSSLLEVFPDAIVNCAGLTEGSQCEADPAAARRLNTEVPRLLGRLAHHLSARLVQISTDLVFSQGAAPFSPASAANPAGVYAATKLAGEHAVLEGAPDFATVLRLPLLSGNSPSSTRSLHERLFSAFASGQPVRLFTDEVRQPLDVEDAGSAVVEILERDDCRGVHHWAGPEALSRAEIGRLVAEHFRLPLDRISAVEAAADPATAGRPRDLRLSCDTLLGRLRNRARPFSQTLEGLKVPLPWRAWFHSLPG